LGALEKLLEHLDLPRVSGDDPVRAKDTFDWDELRRIPVAAHGVQGHVHVLALVGYGGASRVLAQPAYVVAELERLLHARHLLFRWVVQGEPEQLSLVEPLKRGCPILDLFGLVYVEHEGGEHLPWFSRGHCVSLCPSIICQPTNRV
jgi:hypothetical protein